MLARISHQTPSPGHILLGRMSWPGKEESAIRPEAYCMSLPSVVFDLRQLGLSIEDRIVGSDAVQGATYGVAAGWW